MKDSIEERLKKIEYHQKLLLLMLKGHKYPVYEVIIKSGLNEEETGELFALCEEFSKEYEEQKKAGFVHFDSLLDQFVELLNGKLNPKEIIEAFSEQHLFHSVMEEFKKILSPKRTN